MIFCCWFLLFNAHECTRTDTYWHKGPNLKRLIWTLSLWRSNRFVYTQILGVVWIFFLYINFFAPFPPTLHKLWLVISYFDHNRTPDCVGIKAYLIANDWIHWWFDYKRMPYLLWSFYKFVGLYLPLRIHPYETLKNDLPTPPHCPEKCDLHLDKFSSSPSPI